MNKMSDHDKKVQQEAEKLKRKGFPDVRADIKGYPKPPNFCGCRPDIYGEKGSKKVIIEIETPESMKSDVEQRECLRSAAKRIGAEFKIEVTDE
jgi:hypothetical protein